MSTVLRRFILTNYGKCGIIVTVHCTAKDFFGKLNGRRLRIIPSKGGVAMQYVTLSDILTYSLVIISIIDLCLTAFVALNKKK